MATWPLNPWRTDLLLRIQSEPRTRINKWTRKKTWTKTNTWTRTKTKTRTRIVCILKVSDKNVCRDCTATYKNAGCIKTHMLKVHLYTNIEFICETCTNTFDMVHKLSWHKKSHLNVQWMYSECIILSCTLYQYIESHYDVYS